MNQISEIKLNDNIIIHKSSFDWKYPKEVLVSKVKQNLSYIGLDDLTISNFHIQSNEINYLKSYCRDLAIQVLGKNPNDISSWVEQFWIYSSDKKTNVKEGEADLYHSHPITITTSSSKPLNNIKTDISYCFYLNVPSDLKGDEGKLMFKDVDKNEVGILPKTGDIIFFNPNYLHRPNFVHSSDEERIAICSNLTINLRENLGGETLI